MARKTLLALIERALQWAFREPGLAISAVHLEQTITFETDGDRWRYRVVDYSKPFGCRMDLLGSYVWGSDVLAAVDRAMARSRSAKAVR